ncbi:hypothetical protein [Chryseobacterium luteum]|uniref:Uncharacterized protein n=1 Tax=Chryseobacterium luteum TaxID=421531 RepID=A0A085Z0B9_9FLAO|nr:hypothetical protein [Chryseobacterium luteum]KFE97882.1 hypothetical protein IX38_19650 [Chryseobacterium luteum]
MTNLNTYRFESIVSEEIMPNYFTEKKYTRTVEIFFFIKYKELYHYQILCTKFDFSDQDTAVGFFLKKISYLFDELDVYADEENNIVKINNISSLRLRWQELKTKLWETNKGDEVENYFRNISSVLDNEKNLISFLQSYNMFGLYFNGQSGQYADDGKKIRVITEGKIEYLHKQDLSPEETEIKMKVSKDKNENYIEGTAIYEKGILRENFVQSKENKCEIKYSLLWVG